MTLLSVATQMLRAIQHRRQVRSLAELDDRTLADIGLLQMDSMPPLGRPKFAGPAKALKHACCHWRTSESGFRPSSEPVPCC